MADEKIGGISVSIGGEDDALESALNRAEQKIKAWVDKVNAGYGINLDVTTSGRGGGGRSTNQSPDEWMRQYGNTPLGRAVQAQMAGGAATRMPGETRPPESFRQQSQQIQQVTQVVGRLNQIVSVPRMAQPGAAMAPMGYADISRTVTAALTAVMRSPALPMLVARIDKLSPARVPASSDEGAGVTQRARRQGTAIADTLVEKAKSATEDPFTSRRHPLQIVGEPKPGMNAPVAVEPASLSRQRSAAMLAASRVQTFEPESELEQRRSEIERRRVASATALSVGSRNQAPTPGEQRLLDALYPPESARRRARSAANLARLGDYPPGNSAEETVGFAPQRGPNSVTETSRPRIGTSMALPRGTTSDEAVNEVGAAAYMRGAGGRGGGAYRRTEADVEERERQRVIRGEAQAVAAGRTPRTQASSLGGFLSGRKNLIAAEAALAAANEKVAIAQRRAESPEVLRDVVAHRHAVEELTAAQTEQAGALEKVQSFSGFAAGAKNLLGVTLAGAAFGVGLEGVNMAVRAAERAATPYFAAMTGWAAQTADLTNKLSDQARATQGNAKGVVALNLAQAGFSDTTAASLQPLIAQRAQVEAGNKAIMDQVGMIRANQNLARQNPNAGIVGGGTGGVLGTGIFGTASTGEQIGNFLQSLNDVPGAFTTATGMSPAEYAGLAQGGQYGAIQQKTAAAPGMGAVNDIAARQVRQGVEYVNSQLVKGGDAAAKFSVALDKTDPRIEATAKQFDNIQPEMAKAVRELGLFSPGITDVTSAINAFKAINLAGTITGPQEQLQAQKITQQNAANSLLAIQSQQAYQLPAFMNQQVRTQQYAANVQAPVQAYLANLAAPPTRIGSAVAAAGGLAGGAAEQQKINAGIKEAQGLQDQLNAYYAKGQQQIAMTYDPSIFRMFGQQGVDTFHTLLSQVGEVGAKMSDIQSGINMEQASYAAAQYTNEIRIAQRSLTDIRQLTGQIGATSGDNLGIYERQNLLLGRQAQQLQFMLSQRQINLQTAIAGFVVPGLTPAEQNARVQEAKTEASYAQKQLDIQKAMFGNQVKIVDIGNLRQATDLIHSLGLLQRGRAVTIDVALKQETLVRLQKMQTQMMAEVQGYVGAVDSLQGKYISNLAEQEAATGAAVAHIAVKGAQAAYSVGHAFFLGISGGFLPSSAVPSGSTGGQGGGGGGGHQIKNASGYLGTVSGATNMIMGEAGTETVAILRNPKTASGGVGLGGDTHFTIPIELTIDGTRLYAMVIKRMGKDAATRGLRGPN